MNTYQILKDTRILISIFLLCFNFVEYANGQISKKETSYPEIGKLCPSFTLKNIKYYSKQKAELKDFKGKWLILDFWNKGCGACVKNFPETSSMQNKFSKNVQFMMVAIQDKENQIKPMFDKFRQIENLLMPCAFDSTLAKKWDIFTAPYMIVVDPNGIIQAITYSIQPQDIDDFIHGKHPSLMKAYREHEVSIDKLPYDLTKPFMVNNNGARDTDFKFRSLLSEFKSYMQISNSDKFYDSDISKGRFETVATVFELYNLAYLGRKRIGFSDHQYGQEYDYPIAEISDTTIFHYKKNNLIFCYSLVVPCQKSSEHYLMQCMQRDIKNYFDYEVSVEKRLMPCWKLVSLGTNTLRKSKGDSTYVKSLRGAGFLAKNLPIKDLVNTIIIAQYKYPTPYILIDETGIKYNIDIDLSNCLLSDFDGLKKSLNINGLDLVLGEKEMKVIVLRDPKVTEINK